MILVDTDVLIAHLRGNTVAHEWLRATRRATGRLSISAVTMTELLGGMRSGERREVARLLSSLRQLPVSPAIARRAGAHLRQFRASHTGIGLGDYLVAATVDEYGLDLATLNTKHFPMYPSLARPFEVS